MLKISIVGCGQWGPNHVRNFNSLPTSKVVSIVDTDEIRLSRIQDLYPSIRTEKRYQSALEDPEVDAVVVSTPTSTHFSIVREALLAGKHVLCEKPLCEKNMEAQHLVQMASERKLVLVVGHVFLFNPGIIKVKELLDAGEVGNLHYVSAVRTNLGPIRTDVNAAIDLASHDISIFNWILDSEPELVSAIGASFLQSNLEDVVFISLRYPGNILANIQASWLNPRKVRQISFIGTRKMVTWDDLDLTTPIAIYDKGADAKQGYNDFGEFLRISMWDGDVRLPKVKFDEPLKIQNRHFLDAIGNGGVVDRAGVKFASGVVKALEAVLMSVQCNGAPISLRT